MPGTERVFVAFGGNVGAVEENLHAALRAVAALPETRLLRLSSLYRTAPVGGLDQPPFLNGACEVATAQQPVAFLRSLLAVEKSLGRVRELRWGPRTVDLDLILWGDRVLRSPELELPHPRMHERGFVLIPLAEIAAEVRHPLLGKTVGALASEMGASTDIECLGPPAWAAVAEEGTR